MTSSFHKAIKQILKEIDNFLTSTLKDQTLNKTAEKERTKLIGSLQKLYNDFTEIRPPPAKEEPKSTPTPSLSRIGSQASEEGCTNEYNIPQTTVSALKGPTMYGYLFQRKTGDAKQKLSKQKKKFCVIHENIMYWFIKPSDKNFHGAVYLNDCELDNVSQKEKEFMFQLVFPSKNDSYEFQADNREDLDEWMKAVKKGIQCGKEKETDTVDGENTYFEAVSLKTPTYINELSAQEEEQGSVYDDLEDTMEKMKKREGEFRSSIPRQRAPGTPASPTPVIDDVKLPLAPSKGKNLSNPIKTKIIGKAVSELQEKFNKLSNSNDSKNTQKSKSFVPSSSSSSSSSSSTLSSFPAATTTKPKTLSDVKLKSVTMSPGLRLREEEQTPTTTTTTTAEEDDTYDTVEHVAAAMGIARGVSVPTSKPPQQPRRNENVYVNQPDTDNIEYELQ